MRQWAGGLLGKMAGYDGPFFINGLWSEIKSYYIY